MDTIRTRFFVVFLRHCLLLPLLCVGFQRALAIENCVTNWASLIASVGVTTNTVRSTNFWECTATASATVSGSGACTGDIANHVITGEDIPTGSQPCAASDSAFYADGAVWWGAAHKVFTPSGDGPGGTCTITAHYRAEVYTTNSEVGYFLPRAGMDEVFTQELADIAALNVGTQQKIDGGIFVDFGGGCCYSDPDPTQVNYLIKNVSGYRVGWFAINPVVPTYFSQPGGGYNYATGGWQRFGRGVDLSALLKPTTKEETTGDFVQFAEFMIFSYDGGDPFGQTGWVAVRATGERVNVTAGPCGGAPLGDGLGGTNNTFGAFGAGSKDPFATNQPWNGGTNVLFGRITNVLGDSFKRIIPTPVPPGNRKFIIPFDHDLNDGHDIEIPLDEGPISDIAKYVRGLMQWGLAVLTISTCWRILAQAVENK